MGIVDYLLLLQEGDQVLGELVAILESSVESLVGVIPSQNDGAVIDVSTDPIEDVGVELVAQLFRGRIVPSLLLDDGLEEAFIGAVAARVCGEEADLVFRIFKDEALERSEVVPVGGELVFAREEDLLLFKVLANSLAGEVVGKLRHGEAEHGLFDFVLSVFLFFGVVVVVDVDSILLQLLLGAVYEAEVFDLG